MSIRRPHESDFPKLFSRSFTISSPANTSTSEENVLILLHGLGDTHLPFSTLGRNINLPETTCISLRGFSPVPASFVDASKDGSWHWGEDVLLDSQNGGIDMDTGFANSVGRIREHVVQPLTDICGYPLRNIFVFGFGQGGMLALSLAASYKEDELGGITTIGGPLSTSISRPASKNKTPVLLCGGNSQTAVTRDQLARIKDVFEQIEYVRWDRAGDGMPKDRGEMLPLMRFWARRLRSRAGVPPGATEL